MLNVDAMQPVRSAPRRGRIMNGITCDIEPDINMIRAEIAEFTAASRRSPAAAN